MEDFLLNSSYFGIFVVLVLTGCGLPLPEEVPIVVAGVLAADGTLKNVYLALATCLLGAVAGDCVMYYIGHHFGRSWLREHPFLARHLTPERERQIEEKIRQHGLKVFFLARFMLGVRAPIYITCGIMRVPFRRFLFADAISASVVVSLVFGLSYWFGEDVRIWIKRSEWAITIIVAIVVIVVAVVMYRKYRRRHRAAAQPTDVEPPGPHAADADADASSERSSEPPH
ncbi:MAG: DedA family protein [Planctomycetes bacterium]|nr:DedA family protein [Planctomycetota bacterium]